MSVCDVEGNLTLFTTLNLDVQEKLDSVYREIQESRKRMDALESLLENCVLDVRDTGGELMTFVKNVSEDLAKESTVINPLLLDCIHVLAALSIGGTLGLGLRLGYLSTAFGAITQAIGPFLPLAILSFSILQLYEQPLTLSIIKFSGIFLFCLVVRNLLSNENENSPLSPSIIASTCALVLIASTSSQVGSSKISFGMASKPRSSSDLYTEDELQSIASTKLASVDLVALQVWVNNVKGRKSSTSASSTIAPSHVAAASVPSALEEHRHEEKSEVKNDPADDATIIFEEVDTLCKQKNHADAVKLLEKQLKSSPRDEEVLWRLARSLSSLEASSKAEKKDNVARAWKLIEDALDICDTNWLIHKWFAIILSRRQV
jgi:hypothetical protein